MNKIIVAFLFVILVACDSQNEEKINLTGIVANTTSCGGDSEPVFVIKLSDETFIMTATLPEEFQIPDLEIQFKTKKPSVIVYCTTDKIYPKQLDVYDVSSFSN